MQRTEIEEFPRSILARVVKKQLGPKERISKEALGAVSKAASTFVLYLTAAANEKTTSKGRSTISPSDVVDCLKSIEYDFMEDEMQAFAAALTKAAADKKKGLPTEPAKKQGSSSGGDVKMAEASADDGSEEGEDDDDGDDGDAEDDGSEGSSSDESESDDDDEDDEDNKAKSDHEDIDDD